MSPRAKVKTGLIVRLCNTNMDLERSLALIIKTLNFAVWNERIIRIVEKPFDVISYSRFFVIKTNQCQQRVQVKYIQSRTTAWAVMYGRFIHNDEQHYVGLERWHSNLYSNDEDDWSILKAKIFHFDVMVRFSPNFGKNIATTTTYLYTFVSPSAVHAMLLALKGSQDAREILDHRPYSAPDAHQSPQDDKVVIRQDLLTITNKTCQYNPKGCIPRTLICLF